SSVVSSIKSTISVEPPSQSIVLKQLSTFTNTLSSAAQQSMLILSHFHISSYVE
ncbi:unnamed protein product, partial [Rotaria sp. Silwood2]